MNTTVSQSIADGPMADAGPCVSPRFSAARRVRNRIGIIAFAYLLVLVLASAVAAPAALARSSPKAAALTRAIKHVLDRDSIPGAIVGVWQQGTTPYVRAFGVRDMSTGQRMTTDLHMRIGSVTKTFTVTAILQLVDQGKVGFDSPISRYVAGVPGGQAITIRELAEMRSGLFDYTSNDTFWRAELADPSQQWTPRQVLAYSFSKPPAFAPGTSYNYSNTNTVLLGLVVERVSHQPLATYIARHIIRPEHLTQTIFPSGMEFPSPHAQGYTDIECAILHQACGKIANSTAWNPSWGGAAGAMISTVADLHHWAREVATGTLLSRATQRQRTKFIAIPGVRNVGYGLGLVDVNGWIGHNGDIPGYLSIAAYLPSQRATLVLLCNSDLGRHQQPFRELAAAITRIIAPRHVYEYVADTP